MFFCADVRVEAVEEADFGSVPVAVGVKVVEGEER
jgi:hypothetical protein